MRHFVWTAFWVASHIGSVGVSVSVSFSSDIFHLFIILEEVVQLEIILWTGHGEATGYGCYYSTVQYGACPCFRVDMDGSFTVNICTRPINIFPSLQDLAEVAISSELDPSHHF